MKEHPPQPTPNDEEWEKFSKQANKEMVPHYQIELGRKISDLVQYIEKIPDDMPEKEQILSLSRAIADSITPYGIPEKTRDRFWDVLNHRLHPLRYEVISKKRLFELEDRAELRGDEDWLKNEAAAQEELERVRPWADNGIGDERESAQAHMEIIYSHFPNLRPKS